MLCRTQKLKYFWATADRGATNTDTILAHRTSLSELAGSGVVLAPAEPPHQPVLVRTVVRHLGVDNKVILMQHH
jgi:hypothetical protein